jgi:hypothetical protein
MIFNWININIYYMEAPTRERRNVRERFIFTLCATARLVAAPGLWRKAQK